MHRPKLVGRRRECEVLDRLVADAQSGRSGVLVIRGDAGVGKSALLGYLLAQVEGWQVARAAGVESEMELAYSGLHQLCGPLLHLLDHLPAPQRDALATVFGHATGSMPPDRFLVGLATLTLIAEAADQQPLVCVIDDTQWLDQASAQVLWFVARRLQAESVTLVFALREHAELPQLAGFPEIEIAGLADRDARQLLASIVPGRLDERVRDRIIAETRGNPLALLELPRHLSEQELAGGFGTGLTALPNRVEDGFGRRLADLPGETRRLLLIAAAEPLGDPILLWRAAQQQGIATHAAAAATEAQLCEFDTSVRFLHPLVRSAVYRAASSEERCRAHASLAEVIDPKADPDRRAWHRALAAAGPDVAIADELERSAARARARGGQAAAAAFLERSMVLTLDPALRAERALAAAEAKLLAGSADSALQLATDAERGPLDELQRVRVDVLRGQVATMQRRGTDGPPLLLRAAQRLDQLEDRLARDTYRDAYWSAYLAGRLAGDTSIRDVAAAVRAATGSAEGSSVTDRLLNAAALLVDAGPAVGVPAVRLALEEIRTAPLPPETELRWLGMACILAVDLWDEEAWDALSARHIAIVQHAGVLALLPLPISMRVGLDVFAGDLALATQRVDQADSLIAAPSPTSNIALAAFKGREAEVARLDRVTTEDAVSRGDGKWMTVRAWSTAVLCNGLGRYGEALAAAEQAVVYRDDGGVANWALPELVEAAARIGQPEAADAAVARLGEMAKHCGTDWILGVEARARALVADRGQEAEALYRKAIKHLSRTRLRTEIARGRLVYGEWLRREGRRVDAREELREAHAMLSEMGVEAFATRALHELLATGEKVRKRSGDTREELTPQEVQVAKLAGEGLSNPEIGARLFLSPRTVEWHLSKVFTKLGIRSRHELSSASLSSRPG